VDGNVLTVIEMDNRRIARVQILLAPMTPVAEAE
jgi:hypothetical protein